MTEEKANKVYDLLVLIGKAKEYERGSFIYHHCKDKFGCSEWRFCGNLGFGGKYRSTLNSVTYYTEDETPELINIKNQLNRELHKI
jgi:hypothetical protein